MDRPRVPRGGTQTGGQWTENRRPEGVDLGRHLKLDRATSAALDTLTHNLAARGGGRTLVVGDISNIHNMPSDCQESRPGADPRYSSPAPPLGKRGRERGGSPFLSKWSGPHGAF